MKKSNLFELGKLWYTLYLYHPFLLYKNIDWMHSFQKAYNKLKNNPEDIEGSIIGLINSINDPYTQICGLDKIENPHAQNKYSINNNLMCIQINNFGLVDESKETLKIFQNAKSDLKDIETVIFDFRNYNGNSQFLDFYLKQSGLLNSITEEDIEVPSVRSVEYYGYPDENGNQSYYYPYFKVIPSLSINPNNGSKNKKIVIFSNKHTKIPLELVGFLKANKAKLVIENGESPILFEKNYLNVLTSKVAYRTEEVIFSDSKSGLKVDYNMSNNENIFDVAEKVYELDIPILDFNNVSSTITRNQRYNWGNEFPEEAYRVLAIIKFWFTIEYFYPHKNIKKNEWLVLFNIFVEKAINADTDIDYHRIIMQLAAKLDDSHVWCSSETIYTKIFDLNDVPFWTQFIENKLIITQFKDDNICKNCNIMIGDEIIEIENTTVDEKYNELNNLLSGSNKRSLDKIISATIFLTFNGNNLNLRIKRESEKISTIVPKKREYNLGMQGSPLSYEYEVYDDSTLYLNLTKIKLNKCKNILSRNRNCSKLILDIRGYGSVFYTKFVPLISTGKFKIGNVKINTNKSSIRTEYKENIRTTMSVEDYTFYSLNPIIMPKLVVILMNEYAQSASEGLISAIKSCTNAVLVGSRTTGANGDITSVFLPGRINVTFTGMKVYNLDKSEQQRFGIKPDYEIIPKISNVRAGIDEILEFALQL